MRVAVLAVMSALALAACNPSTPSSQAPSVSQADNGGGPFPNLANAAYRAEGVMSRGGQSIPVVMIRDGRKLRMEINASQGQSVIISNGETGESLIMTNMGGRTMAMRATEDQFDDPVESWQGEMASTATRTGACSQAGESGSEWSRTESDGNASTACVTGDGIILLATRNGETVWQTTSVQRGPQSADLFALPAGVRVMDLNNIPGVADAMARARAAAGQ
ncbi:MAG: hypothetical protein R3C25_01575 [Hyphomonadaceae bacterium]